MQCSVFVHSYMYVYVFVSSSAYKIIAHRYVTEKSNNFEKKVFDWKTNRKFE